MEGIPLWLKVAFSKRVDMVGQQLNDRPKNKMARAKVAELLEKLLTSFSEDQRRQFDEWEDLMGLQEAQERDNLYGRGFLDGFQTFESLSDLIHQTSEHEQACKSV